MSTRQIDRVLAKYAHQSHAPSVLGGIFRRFWPKSRHDDPEMASQLVQLNTGKFVTRSTADDIKASLDKLLYGSEETRRQAENLERQIRSLQEELQLVRQEDCIPSKRTPGKIRIELKEKELRLHQLRHGGVEALSLLYRVCRFGERPDVNGKDLFTSHLLFQHKLMDLSGHVYPEVKKVVLASVLPSAKIRQPSPQSLTVVTPYDEDNQPLPFAVCETLN